MAYLEKQGKNVLKLSLFFLIHNFLDQSLNKSMNTNLNISKLESNYTCKDKKIYKKPETPQINMNYSFHQVSTGNLLLLIKFKCFS